MKAKMNRFVCFLVFMIGLTAVGQTSDSRFLYHQRLIFLRMKVEQTDSLLFLLDTGANVSAIDSETADILGLSHIKSDTVEGTMGKIVVPSVNVTLAISGNADVRSLLVTQYDLSTAAAPPNEKLHGILGMDFLKDFVVSIHFPERRIHFSLPPDSAARVIMPIFFDNGIPAISAQLNENIAADFRFDTGSSLFETDDIFVNTTTAVLRQLQLADSLLKPALHLQGSGIGGTAKLSAYKIDSMVFGGVEIKHPFLIVQSEVGYFARPDAIGFLGNNLLEKFGSLTFDFPGNRLYLQRPSAVNNNIIFKEN